MWQLYILTLLNAGATGTPVSTLRPPAISKANLSDLIKGALKQSHPTVTVVLNRRVALDGSIPYEVLENDGILAPAKVAAPSCDSGPAYVLAERGKHTSVSRGWQISTSLMVIPIWGIQYRKRCNNQEIVGVAGVDGQVYQYTQLDSALAEFQAAYAKARAAGQAVPLSWLGTPRSSNYASTSYQSEQQYFA